MTTTHKTSLNPAQTTALRMLSRVYARLLAKLNAVEYEVDVVLKKMRSTFSGRGISNNAGDAAFRQYLIAEHGLNEVAAKEALTRALAGEVYASQEQVTAVGGYRSMRSVMFLPREEQISIMVEARSQHKVVATVARERAAAKNPRPATVRVSGTLDAKALAEFIDAHVRRVPTEVRAIVERYVPARVLRSVA